MVRLDAAPGPWHVPLTSMLVPINSGALVSVLEVGIVVRTCLRAPGTWQDTKTRVAESELVWGLDLAGAQMSGLGGGRPRPAL